jgi:hypothetical protein
MCTAAKHVTQILCCEAILEYELNQINSEPISEKPGRINGTVLQDCFMAVYVCH